MTAKFYCIIALTAICIQPLTAQDTEYAWGTFNSEKIINSQSVEMATPGEMTFIIQHRFGRLNEGIYELFGLDQSSIRLGLDYGIKKNLMIGVGRSSFNKTYDSYFKLRLLQQKKGGCNFPATISWYSGIAAQTIDRSTDDKEIQLADRLSYYNQLLIARKFSDNFSLQLMPSHIHINVVPTADDDNDILAIGAGGRFRISHKVSLNAEYYYILSQATADTYKNSLSFGLDIQTGGHMFQLHFTNSAGMTDNYFIGRTTGDFAKGDIQFGFNITRVFNICGKERG